MEGRPDAVMLAAFAALILLAGGNAVGIWYSNAELAPFWGGTLRFALAAALFAAVGLGTRRRFPRGGALGGAIGYGILGFGLFYALAYWSILYVAPGMAQVVLALVPLATLLLAVAERQEPFRWPGLAGALLALIGIALVFWQQIQLDVPPLALIAIVGAAVSAAQAALIVKRYGKGDPVATNAIAMTVGAAILLALALVAREPLTLPSARATWLALAYLVIGGSFAVFALYLYVLRRWTASAASYQFVLFPFVTLTLSAWLTGERLTPMLAVGGLLVLAGVYVGALRRGRARPNERDAERARA